MVRPRGTKPGGALSGSDAGAWDCSAYGPQAMERGRGRFSFDCSPDHYSGCGADEPVFAETACMGPRPSARFAFVRFDAHAVAFGPRGGDEYGPAEGSLS